MPVERRDAHIGLLCQRLDAHWFGEVAPYPLDGQADPSDGAVWRRYVAQHRALRPLQHPVKNLAFIHWRQRGYVGGTFHQAQHADPCIHQIRGNGSDRKPVSRFGYQDTAHHHDAQWLPNGNLLYAACSPVPLAFAERVPGGTAHAPDEAMYGDVIREVNRAGELVWEWKAWEHLDPKDFPIAPGFGRYHWPLVNGLGVDARGEVLMSLRTTSGVIAVDRQTGGVTMHIPPSLVSHQHSPVALANGNILVFDNGNSRTGAHVAFSRVLEIDPASREVVWSYADDMVNMFYSAFMGNAQRLPNGNTHITESATGRLFEVTPAGQVVWEYVIPWFGEYPDEAARRTGPGQLNSVFQTFRYSREQLPWLRA